jgi:hypothetical protein
MNVIRSQFGRLETLWKDDVGLSIQKAKRPRHHANHFAWARVDRQHTSEDASVAAESTLPVAVSQHHGFRCTWRVVCL